MPGKTYIALWPVKFDGALHPAGAVIEPPAKVAAQLLALGAIEPAPEAAAAPIDRDAIVGAIGKLDPENTDHWTQAGAPDVRALEAVLGGQITAKARDAAWAEVQKAKE